MTRQWQLQGLQQTNVPCVRPQAVELRIAEHDDAHDALLHGTFEVEQRGVMIPDPGEGDAQVEWGHVRVSCPINET